MARYHADKCVHEVTLLLFKVISKYWQLIILVCMLDFSMPMSIISFEGVIILAGYNERSFATLISSQNLNINWKTLINHAT